MKMFAVLGRALVLSSLVAGATAHADPIPVAGALVSTDPTQLGRLSRNAISQTYDGSEPFPGLINPSTPYHYHLYYFNIGLTPYIDISIDSVSANTFFSAYQTVYNPTNLQIGWLGDAGTSGNTFSGTNPLSFQVLAGLNSTLIIAVNETTTNAGIGAPFTLFVQGSSDTSFTGLRDIGPVSADQRIPEPSTVLLLLAPLALYGARRAVKRSAASNDGMALAA